MIMIVFANRAVPVRVFVAMWVGLIVPRVAAVAMIAIAIKPAFVMRVVNVAAHAMVFGKNIVMEPTTWKRGACVIIAIAGRVVNASVPVANGTGVLAMVRIIPKRAVLVMPALAVPAVIVIVYAVIPGHIVAGAIPTRKGGVPVMPVLAVPAVGIVVLVGSFGRRHAKVGLKIAVAMKFAFAMRVVNANVFAVNGKAGHVTARQTPKQVAPAMPSVFAECAVRAIVFVATGRAKSAMVQRIAKPVALAI